MPKFVIERQYLIPMYQHIVVEAENLEEACKKGISDDIDWGTQEMDCDSARATTITAVKNVPEGIVNLIGRGMLVVSVERQLGSRNSFARLLCCPAQAERGRKKAHWVR